jgi:hypothetical protein
VLRLSLPHYARFFSISYTLYYLKFVSLYYFPDSGIVSSLLIILIPFAQTSQFLSVSFFAKTAISLLK